MPNGRSLRAPRFASAPNVTPLRSITLTSASTDALPSWCDAVVEEQDRWLVLGQSPRSGNPTDWISDVANRSVDELLEELETTEPAAGGTVLMRRGRPLRLLAVVRDLDAQPSVREEWVAHALETVVRMMSRTRLRGIALPMLGTRARVTDTDRFADLLLDAIRRAGPARSRIAMLTPPGVARHLAAAMRMTAQDIEVRFETQQRPRRSQSG